MRVTGQFHCPPLLSWWERSLVLPGGPKFGLNAVRRRKIPFLLGINPDILAVSLLRLSCLPCSKVDTKIQAFKFSCAHSIYLFSTLQRVFWFCFVKNDHTVFQTSRIMTRNPVTTLQCFYTTIRVGALSDKNKHATRDVLSSAYWVHECPGCGFDSVFGCSRLSTGSTYMTGKNVMYCPDKRFLSFSTLSIYGQIIMHSSYNK